MGVLYFHKTISSTPLVRLNYSHYINTLLHTLSIFFYFFFLFLFLAIFVKSWSKKMTNPLCGFAVWAVRWLLVTRNWSLKVFEAKIFCNNDVNQRPWSFWIVALWEHSLVCVKTWSWCRGEVSIGIKWNPAPKVTNDNLASFQRLSKNTGMNNTLGYPLVFMVFKYLAWRSFKLDGSLTFLHWEWVQLC